ncbi:MAG: hypothetical protein QOD32_1845 [Pyrinomonadaceae bacterium]|jgi:hypothetical protein|nr:hypothetical protein [Pyrinomonadaceae bacterium]
MPTPLALPLHLYQVLEEEYLSLHGPLPDDKNFFIELHDDDEASEWRRVKSTRDWLFREGHLKDPRSFVLRLFPYAPPPPGLTAPPPVKQSVAPTDAGGDAPSAYVRSKLSSALLTSLEECAQWGRNAPLPAGLTRQIEEELNEKILTDENLYDADRFKDVHLADVSKGFVKLRSSADTFQADDLAHFNRLLLEDAFPEVIERLHLIRLTAIHQHFHARKQTALCLSGGGIRSGTFALGLIQGLARHNLLEKFDYLSTVSGGGYIGGWLTAWLHRHPRGLEGVTDDLANSAPRRKIDPDAQPINYLRQYSNFITPKAGLLTADTWTFIGIYLRNLFLNWLVFIPLLVAVLLLPRLLLAVTLMQPDPSPVLFTLKDFNFYPRYIFLIAGFVSGVWALAYIIFNRPGMREQLIKRSRFWRARSDQGTFLRWCLLPLLIAAFCLTTYWAWSRESHSEDNVSTVLVILAFLVFGLLFTLSGWAIASAILRRLPGSVKEYGDLGWLFLAGVVGGFVSWLVSRSAIGNPVVGYKKAPADWEFAWTAMPQSQSALSWILSWKTEWYVCFGVPLFLLVFLIGASIYVGLSSRNQRVNDEDREWWARLGAWNIISIFAWVVSCALVILGPIALLLFPKLLASLGGVSGLIALVVGRSAKTAANSKDEAKAGKASALMGSLLPLLALIFVMVFLSTLSLATTGTIQGLARLADNLTRPAAAAPKIDEPIERNRAFEWLTNVPNEPSSCPPPGAPSPAVNTACPPLHGFDRYINYIYGDVNAGSLDGAKIVHLNVLHHTSFWFLLALLLIMAGVGVMLARAINLNVFSLHGGYRNRLIRGFLGASRPEGQRKPNPFTGFDPKDNLHMHELRPTLLDEGDLLNPGLIATALKSALESKPTDPLSVYLVTNHLLESVKDELQNYQPDNAVPAQLIASLRATLNGVLQNENINLATETSLQPYAQADRAVLAQRAIVAGPRSEYHILFNRVIMEQAYPNALKPSAYPPPPYKLLHVINTALNLVGGDNLAWQQRKAEPFSISPLHAGCYRLGYRRSRDYGGRESNGISIGTAAAISGAAASSNMGYYTTSPILSLLLTLFNVRLGWWLGNPGPAGNSTFSLGAPKYSFKPVVDEAFGLTNDRNKYVYLTDGGHFENLAVYEMVLRRCHIIVASDGAQDEEYRFGDLGNAVRKIRIDLGVPIEFSSVPIYAGAESADKGRGFYWALGKIRYSCIDRNAQDGVLLYIKPAVYGREPRDVLEYQKNFPSFPHQSTGDQFFDEPQFESYRVLGSYIMDRLCGEGTAPLDLYTVVDNAFKKAREASVLTDAAFIEWLENWLRRTN